MLLGVLGPLLPGGRWLWFSDSGPTEEEYKQWVRELELWRWQVAEAQQDYLGKEGGHKKIQNTFDVTRHAHCEARCDARSKNIAPRRDPLNVALLSKGQVEEGVGNCAEQA
ncbi:hypothetical protein NC653_010077 [Populus alba x Populus x berolinensis]|uniref:Uncharacterized protein n=1 Tax=Populus alba x Populus x berolinensis TaxID=444605 RepID=A0AAD6QZ19_9ROSI|nr:hypothetical protein NC653_010077 [Populus alba x Populus x berolinensis]